MLQPLMPPTANCDGVERTVGFEYEFMGLSPAEAASIVADVFGGQVVETGPHDQRVENSARGTFKIELDSRDARAPFQADKPTLVDNVRQAGADMFGALAQGLVPCEIVTPPLAMSELQCLGELEDRLAGAGAKGTHEAAHDAVGLHINPQVATHEPDWILAVVRAQVLATDWLKSVMRIDLSRRLTGFAAPYADQYLTRLMAPTSAPSRSEMIDDYITHNPTRNCELDLLPLFAHLDPERVRARLPDEKIGARPTFHYRLPNVEIGTVTWSAIREWNRWVLIEQIADDRAFLTLLAEHFDAARSGLTGGPGWGDCWAVASGGLIVEWLQQKAV